MAEEAGNNVDVRDSLVKAAKDLWEKSRTNAFAHKVAGQRNLRKAGVITNASITFGILSIVAILFAYLVGQPDVNGTSDEVIKAIDSKDPIVILLGEIVDFPEELEAKILKGKAALYLTIISIISSVVSLLLTIVSGINNYASLANEHEILQSFCLDVSQKIRPVRDDRPCLSITDMKEALRNLEEQFRLIKMRGSEPDDKSFDKAHYIMAKRKDDPLRVVVYKAGRKLLGS